MPAGSLRLVTSIIKGIAAIFAMVVVGHSGGAHLSVTHRATVASAEESADRQDNPLVRGHRNQAFGVPPPAPAPAEAPLANPPIAQLARPAPPPAPPAPQIGSDQQALINQDRAAAGLGPLSWSPCLAGIAYQNAVRMANQDAISHTGGAQASLGCGLGSRAGENIGYWSGGINDGQLNATFMNSPGHRENILGNYRYAGTAWVVAANGHAYIAVEFS